MSIIPRHAYSFCREVVRATAVGLGLVADFSGCEPRRAKETSVASVWDSGCDDPRPIIIPDSGAI